MIYNILLIILKKIKVILLDLLKGLLISIIIFILFLVIYKFFYNKNFNIIDYLILNIIGGG